MLEAKTARCLNLMTLSRDLLCRRGLEGFKTRSNNNKNTRKPEKRDEKREERENTGQKERSEGSGVALGRPNGGPRGYEGHWPDTAPPKVGGGRASLQVYDSGTQRI